MSKITTHDVLHKIHADEHITTTMQHCCSTVDYCKLQNLVILSIKCSAIIKYYGKLVVKLLSLYSFCKIKISMIFVKIPVTIARAKRNPAIPLIIILQMLLNVRCL